MLETGEQLKMHCGLWIEYTLHPYGCASRCILFRSHDAAAQDAAKRHHHMTLVMYSELR